MKKLFKKIISLTYLIIFLFGFFIPFNQVLAQDANNQLRIVADKLNLKLGEDIFITAKTYQLSNKVISFQSSPAEGIVFSPSICTTDGNAFSTINSCQVGFGSTKEGTFKITASMVYNGTTSSNEIEISITKDGGVIKNCPTGQILVNNICTTPATVKPTTDTTYTPLAPLPGLDKTINTTGECPFGNYLNVIIKLVLGIAAVLAMVMIVMGGIEYMTTELVSSKESGKETIRNAILGLLIALGAYLILNTINPKLLDACLDKLPEAKITILPYNQNINSYMQKTSGNCSVITSGECSVENLKNIFGGKADKASMICNVESGGIVFSKSNSDYCSVGQTTFSFGLFQINLLAHGDKIPSSVGNCTDLFITSKGEEIGVGKKGYVAKDEKSNFSHYDCKLRPERGDDYNKCSAYLKTATGNLSVASKLFQAKVFEDWRLSDQGVCPAAFQ